MAPRPRRAAKPQPSNSSSSDGEREVDERRYRSLELGTALQHPANYCTAVAELEAVLLNLYQLCSKGVQALVVADVERAIGCCDGRPAPRRALAALMEAAERRLPQARRQALTRAYRATGVALARRGRRRAAGHGGAEGGSDEEDAEGEEDGERGPSVRPDVAELPLEIAGMVLRYLDPLALAAAACVNRAWRRSASDDALWEPLLRLAFGARAAGGSGAVAGSTAQASMQQRFAVAAAHTPHALLRWRTNRIERNGRLAWLDRERPRPSGGAYRHLSVQQVVRWLGGGGGSSSDGGTSSSDSEVEGLGLRFWQALR